MLCACSGEQFKLDERPQSPESLATRDFSASGLSSRAGDWDSKFEDAQVDEVESTLKEALSLNYEVGLFVPSILMKLACWFIALLTVPHLRVLNCVWTSFNQEARALLGRLEYQRGNYDAALQVFQGIEVKNLTPKMARAIVESTRPRRPRGKGDNATPSVMSMHSASLLLEAILLKARSLEELGRYIGVSFFPLL